MTSSENLLYFTAGALLPTLALYWFWKPADRVEDGDDSEEDDDSIEQTPVDPNAPSSSWGLAHAPYKMVFCVNTTLKMSKGKIAAQCGHAAVACYRLGIKHCPNGVRAWERTGSAKIAVQCTSSDQFPAIAEAARQKGIPCYIVEDAGRTQIAAGAQTVLGLGPAPTSVYQNVSDHLKLL